jgi:hypothetical protein
MKPLIPLLLLLLIPAQALALDEICEPFDLRCEGSMVQQCNSFGTQWVSIENCTSCSAGQCDPELRINWVLLIAGLSILVIIIIIVRILWKRKSRPPRKIFISKP